MNGSRLGLVPDILQKLAEEAPLARLGNLGDLGVGEGRQFEGRELFLLALLVARCAVRQWCAFRLSRMSIACVCPGLSPGGEGGGGSG